jgi:hypothetical protein
MALPEVILGIRRPDCATDAGKPQTVRTSIEKRPMPGLRDGQQTIPPRRIIIVNKV